MFGLVRLTEEEKKVVDVVFCADHECMGHIVYSEEKGIEPIE